jgi:hypothetical protein
MKEVLRKKTPTEKNPPTMKKRGSNKKCRRLWKLATLCFEATRKESK